ncbi:MAG: TrmH family RNA methyltransferase [Sporichthyaceae bacterium]
MTGAGLIEITDAADLRLGDYARLTDVGHRVRREPAAGVFIAEGATVLHRALAAGFTPRSLLLAPTRRYSCAEAIDAVLALGAPVYLAPPKLLEDLTGFQVHRGLLAAMARRPLPQVADVLLGARRVVVCEDVVNHTNVGTIFRCAAALGIDAVLVSPACADPLYRRAIRTSMGAVFALPWTRCPSWPGVLDELRSAGFTIAALSPAPSALDLAVLAIDPPPRLAWVLGTEGSGLSADALRTADLCVRIPMSGEVDSLNVAAAAAVAFYATRVNCAR